MEEGMSGGFCIQARRGSGGGGGAAGSGTKCGRWNPTAEQVKVLTELFRAGLRTPSTDQIQKISTQLSFYGKIESKNVFYWFQNHKARERQKRRRFSKDTTIATPPHLQLQPSSCLQQIDHHHLRLPTHDIDTSSPTKYFGEINQAPYEAESAIETLQLFPLNSYHEPESEKLRTYSNELKENNNAIFAYAIGRDIDIDHPPLDLRLSFF